ncbi:hypothetical protein J1605_002359 [Eschrichtius robustus]|uniref:Tetraspanin n=1 Tax=Eschrichtius robustus TaxID=9764 RepID=A0AB34HUU3_ESCRO|nr:hypothetical protein J1605_002359 [Eschrichtius robustus]
MQEQVAVALLPGQLAGEREGATRWPVICACDRHFLYFLYERNRKVTLGECPSHPPKLGVVTATIAFSQAHPSGSAPGAAAGRREFGIALPGVRRARLAGGVILGVALWLRHDPQTTNLLYLELGDRPAPNTFYVGRAAGQGAFGAQGALRGQQPPRGLARALRPGQPSRGGSRALFRRFLGSPRAVGPLTGIYILIAVGAVMMFVGFLGCYGAIQESQCLLGTFFTCLVILFACEVAAGIWGFVNKDQIAKDVKQFYDQALQQAIMDDDANNAKAVVKTFHETPADHVFRADGGRPPSLQLNCCGSNALTTVTTSVFKNSLCPSGGNVISNLLKEDCHGKIDELFSGKLYLIGIAAIVVAVIMIFEMILSMVLCCGIRNSSVY